MRIARLAFGPALAAPLAIVALFAASRAEAQIDTIEVGSTPLGPPAVASVPLGDILPAYGAVHLAYRRGPALRHAWKLPDPWQTETVADSSLAFDLAVQGDGLAVLAFSDDHGRLIYAERGPSGWTPDTVGTWAGSALRISVALGPEPAIAFLEVPSSGPATLHYARRSGGSWTVMDLDADPVSSWSPSLAIGPQGQPTVAYLKSAPTLTGGELVVLEGEGALGPFTPAVVDTEAIGFVGLVWDRVRQRPMVHYAAQRASDFEYEYRFAFRDDAGDWPQQTIGSAVFWGFMGASLALDPVGTPGALWQDYQYLGPNLASDLDGCGGVGTGTLELSRQPPAAPSAPFVSTPLARAFAFDTRITNRAVASHEYGTFDVTWREPWSNCAPYAVLYTEVSSGVTHVPLESRPAPGRIDLSPNPLRAGAALQVRWAQPHEAEASVELLDLAGRVLEREAAGRLAPGSHAWSWSPGVRAPGIYWLSLRLDGERAATRLLVIR